MTEQTMAGIGTVAEEAARLIEAMAAMAGSNAVQDKDSDPYAGGRAQAPLPPDEPQTARPDDQTNQQGVPSDSSATGCSACGGNSAGTAVSCKMCPLCQGIALLRSIRPETVDRLADLASALAATLRDAAAQSRSSHAPDATPAAGRPSPTGRGTVYDIPVVDENR